MVSRELALKTVAWFSLGDEPEATTGSLNDFGFEEFATLLNILINLDCSPLVVDGDLVYLS